MARQRAGFTRRGTWQRNTWVWPAPGLRCSTSQTRDSADRRGRRPRAGWRSWRTRAAASCRWLAQNATAVPRTRTAPAASRYRQARGCPLRLLAGIQGFRIGAMPIPHFPVGRNRFDVGVQGRGHNDAVGRIMFVPGQRKGTKQNGTVGNEFRHALCQQTIPPLALAALVARSSTATAAGSRGAAGSGAVGPRCVGSCTGPRSPPPGPVP